MIGSLLYLTFSRPYIMKFMGLVARFQAFPHEIHVPVVKMIFKYLQGTTKYGLWHAKRKEFKLKSYTNYDWAGSLDDRKSTSASSWENAWCHGLARNKPPFLYRLLKQSILLMLPIAHKFYG